MPKKVTHHALGRVIKPYSPDMKRRAKHFDAAALPPIPTGPIDWTGGRTAWGYMLNDTVGDCTCATIGHEVMAWTQAVTGTAVVIPDSAIGALYSRVAGWNPKTGANDNGAVVTEVLAEVETGGCAGHFLYGWAPLDPANDAQIRAALYLFGGVYCGVNLANGNNVAGVKVWDVPAVGIVGGHAIPMLADDGRCVTWGGLVRMTAGFRHARCEEAYGVLAGDWFDKKTGKSPAGFTVQESADFIRALGGTVGPLPPPVVPTPVPTPNPVPPVLSPALNVTIQDLVSGLYYQVVGLPAMKPQPKG